jgi:exodeoxyribonuclease V gamma subunit
MAFLRLPTIAKKFAINTDDLVKITSWLEQASVHWGLDITHKKTLLGSQANASFTWQQGLSRLLRGFAFDDSEAIFQSQLLVNAVEGNDALLLGQLMLFIEQLQSFSVNLQRSRTATQWQQFLLAQLDELFSRIDDNQQSYEHSLLIIEQAISGMVEHCHQAHFNEAICLDIVVDYLTHHFSQGDASKQFMVGQVTFCSMLPMRSIPFKVIAVLGLNDGDFPRQRQPLGFDLMSLSSAQLGDRSRRGDDRYLFLEAIISARQSLYLSYQGRSIKNNTEKQPSIVLKELMEYLTQGYGWQFNDQANTQQKLHKVAMQAFSDKNYQGKWASFNPHWLALGQACQTTEKLTAAPLQDIDKADLQTQQNSTKNIKLSSDELIRFFVHPSKMYAQQQLNLHFDNQQVLLEDVEPFSVNALHSYFLRESLLNASFEKTIELHVNQQNDRQNTLANPKTEQVILEAKLSGKFPDLPTSAQLFADYVEDSQQFHDDIFIAGCENPEPIACQINLDVMGVNVELTSQLAVKGNKLVHYRSSSAKAKDKFTLYLQQLIIQVWQQHFISQPVQDPVDEAQTMLSLVSESVGLYFNTKAQKVERFLVTHISDAKNKLITLLALFFKGQQQPLLLNADIAEHIYKQKRGKPLDMTQANFLVLWQGDLNTRGLSDDDYLHYFWSQCPELDDIKGQFDLVYQDIYHMVSKQAVAKKTKNSAVQSGNNTVNPAVTSSANKASTNQSNNRPKVN